MDSARREVQSYNACSDLSCDNENDLRRNNLLPKLAEYVLVADKLVQRPCDSNCDRILGNCVNSTIFCHLRPNTYPAAN